jgi:hypothetical protein
MKPMAAGAQSHVGDGPFARPTLAWPARWRSVVARAVRIGERETFPILAIATFAILLLASLRNAMTGDGWLVLVAGREIAQHGLPLYDSLTVWSNGQEWIDQQWLAQLLFYGAVSAGGIKAALLLNASILAGSFAFALAISRSIGASSRSVAAVALACVPAAFPYSGLRAQSLAYPLFVAVLGLLVRAGRTPSNAVLLVFPLLAVWANVHGSVLLGAALVSLFGVLEGAKHVARRRPGYSSPVAIALILAPWLCALATPYGLGILDYYRQTAGNAAFFSLVGEWQPSALPAQWPFFVVALPALWCAARARGRLATFELLTLLVTLVAALAAIRNIVWFVFAVVVLVPLTVDPLWPSRANRRVRVNLAVSAAAIVAGAIAAGVAAARPTESYLAAHPPPAADAVAKLASTDPSLRVFANERFADWLIWRAPELAGRIAFDTRFELLSGDELQSIGLWRGRVGRDWRDAARGYRVVLLDPESERDIERALLHENGTRRIFRDASLAVLVRAAQR